MDMLQNNRKCSLCTLQQSKLVVKSDSIACRSYDGSYELFQFSKNLNSNLQHSFERILRMDLLRSLYLTFKTIGYNGLKYDVNSESYFCSSCLNQYYDLQNRKTVRQAKMVSILKETKQFVISSNKLTNLSRQVELVGSDEQKCVNFLMGKFSKQFWLALFRGCGFIVIGANTLNISIYRIQNTKSYQFHSKVKQLRSIPRHLYYQYLQSLVMLLLMQMNSVQFKFNI
ncbi:Hypothetical_protein [Hexamita inflata]|uniref:Hypothetical_protein n=1 Tax=Hexamita inflata TaxID=28002 RepID=A0AA86NW66_9EUKA|nr:Hypothetical protein HINF_LOCUS14743 [Hexamita inflata]